MTTVLRPDGGEVRIAGYDVVREAAHVRRAIGLTGQQVALDPLLSGRENLVMMGRLFGLRTAAARRRADELLARFDLLEAAGRPVKTYSGGMKRRLDLSISLITAPSVLFLDEPSARPRSTPAAPATSTRQFCEHQPVTAVVDSVRALLLGGSPGNTAWIALAWWAGILAVTVPVAGALFRRRTRA